MTIALAAVGMIFVITRSATADTRKITICHRTGSYTNPYVVITVSVHAVDGEMHDDHSHHTGPVFFPTIPKHEKWGDIIPGIANWDAMGQFIYANGCQLPEVVTTTTAPATTTTAAGPTTTSPGTSSTTVPGATTSTTAPGATTTTIGPTGSTMPPTTTTTTPLTQSTIGPQGSTSPPTTLAPTGSLPHTGTDSSVPAMIAGVLLIAGVALLSSREREIAS